MKKALQSVLCGFLAVGSAGAAAAEPKSPDLPWVQMKNGHLLYAEDPAHNRIPDFSTVGYEEGEAPIPDVPVMVRVATPTGQDAAVQDATGLIQNAIESMSKLPVDANGIRGAVLLGPGTLYEQLTLKGRFDAYNQWNLGTGMDGRGLIPCSITRLKTRYR